MDLCIECQANQASATSEECTVAWGVCNVGILLQSIGEKLSVSLLYYTGNMNHSYDIWLLLPYIHLEFDADETVGHS